jgi:lipoprotein-anchoring transpeptidase ErfK/SrfK
MPRPTPLVLLLAGALAPAAQAAIARTQELAVLRTTQQARAQPAPKAASVGLVHATRPITSEHTVLPILRRARGADGRQWVDVMLPGRPNGLAGWIPASATHHAVTSWHIVVKLAARRVDVYSAGRVVRRFAAIVGKPATPTPQGQFFVEETVVMRRHDVGWPYALALSARSAVLQEFAGGPGQIALHGTGNIGGKLGSAVSHGCVRLSARAITWLAGRVGPGVPVTITG